MLKRLILVALIMLSALNDAAAQTLRVMQFNVWQEGTSVPGGLEKIVDVILASRADVVAFSEVRNYRGEDWHTKLLAALKAKAPDKVFYGRFVAGDVGLISRYPLESTQEIFNETKADSGSAMAYRLKRPNGKVFTVVTAHLDYKHYALNWVRGYNGGNPDWKMIDANGDGVPDRRSDATAILEYNRQSRRDEAVAAMIKFAESERAAGRAVIIAGDFNEGSHLDWTEKAKTMTSHYGAAIPWENSIALDKAGLRDAWRAVFPDEISNPGYTWPGTAFGKKTTTWTPLSDERDRIDFIHASPELKPANAYIVGPRTCFVGEQKVEDGGKDLYLCDDLPWPSDHKAVLVEFEG